MSYEDISYQMEQLEHHMAKFTIEVPAEDFEAAMEKAYHKLKGRMSLPGFRKGKAPRKMIEKMYGPEVFYEEAVDELVPEAYEHFLKTCTETIVSGPKFEVTQVEEGKPLIFTAEVALRPDVTLGEYKGLEVHKQDAVVTDEQVEAEIEKERENNARMVDVDDRPVQKGDTIHLDFDGSIDGEPFDGGKAEDYTLEVGSGSFIPGFEDQLFGVGADEDVDVTVTFPEDYHAAELQGKEAVFHCHVHTIQVRQLPEADDEFAQDVSEFDTMDEYRADVRRKLQEQRDEQAKNAIEAEAVAKAVENAQMDLPDAMVDEQVRRLCDEYDRQLRGQGFTLDQYVQMMGMSPDVFKAQVRPEAISRIKNTLVLEEVAKAENLEVTDADVEEEMARMAEQYHMTVERLKELMDEESVEQLKNDLMHIKAARLIRDAAQAVLDPEEEKDDEAEADEAVDVDEAEDAAEASSQEPAGDE